MQKTTWCLRFVEIGQFWVHVMDAEVLNNIEDICTNGLQLVPNLNEKAAHFRILGIFDAQFVELAQEFLNESFPGNVLDFKLAVKPSEVPTLSGFEKAFDEQLREDFEIPDDVGTDEFFDQEMKDSDERHSDILRSYIPQQPLKLVKESEVKPKAVVVVPDEFALLVIVQKDEDALAALKGFLASGGVSESDIANLPVS